MKYSISMFATTLLFAACTNTKKEAAPSIPTVDKVEIPTVEKAIETFKTIADTTLDRFNTLITTKKLKLEEEIMKAYQPKSTETEGNYSYNITKKDIDSQTKEIILVEEGLADDSVAGVKTIMTLKMEKNQLKVVSIKQNYKCHSNRGHQNWSAELCK